MILGGRHKPSRKHWPRNLYRKADGYFWYRNPENGKTKGLGRDKTKAIVAAKKANAFLANKDSSSELVNWVKAVEPKTLAQCADAFFEKYKTNSKARPKIRAANSISQMQSNVTLIKANAGLASKFVHDITTPDINRFLEQVAEVNGLSAAKQRRATLDVIFRQAMSEGLIELGKNPVTPAEKYTKEVTRERLTLEQFMAILSHAPRWLCRAMKLALVSGQAREEISSAMFDDFRDGFWYCVRAKTGTKIRIPVSLRLQALGLSLGDIVVECRDAIDSPHLIHHERDWGRVRRGDRVGVDTISKAFAKARDAAGIAATEGMDPPSFHEIRSLAGRMYEEELGSKLSQKLLGTKSPTENAANKDERTQPWIEANSASANFTQKLLGHSTSKMTATYTDPRGGWIDLATS